MSFDPLHIKLAKLTYRLEKWQNVKVFSVQRNLHIKTKQGEKKWNFSFEYLLEHLGMEEGNHLIQVSRKGFKTNGKEPDFLMAKLANELQQGIYPIVFSVDQFGRKVDVKNFDSVKENWQARKKEIQNLHEGHGLEALLNEMNKGLKNKESFFQKMVSDSSLIGLFLPVYRYYGIEDKIQNDVFQFPILQLGQFRFSGDLTHFGNAENHTSTFGGKIMLSDESSVQNLNDYFEAKNTASEIEGKLVYKRQTGNLPFLKQTIQLDIQISEREWYKEELDYKFLRILR